MSDSHIHGWKTAKFCAPGELIRGEDGWKPAICKVDGEFIDSEDCPEHGDNA